MKKIILSLLLAFSSFCSLAQYTTIKAGTNPTLISPSAALEIESTTKGFLPPRMTSVQMNAIASPATGLMVYCTDCSSVGLSYYTGIAWTSVGSAANSAITSKDGALTFDCTGGGNFVITVVNNTFSDVTIPFSTSDLVLSGVTSGYSVSAVSTASATIPSGGSQVITYTITATTSAANGTTQATWSKLSLKGNGTASTGGTATTQGSGYTAIYNGISAGVTANAALSTYTTGETFNNNTVCANKYVSAGHTATTCTGSVTGASGTVYPLVLINGQCWMKTNLNEKPSTIPTAPTWVNSTDVGWYGYYNGGASEPAAGEGLLYQWSAAMNGQCGERVRGACPAGFHIPSDCEVKYLEHGQGMAITEQNVINAWRANTSTNQGSPGNKLRSAGTGATNTSGFSALLSGYRGLDGDYNSRSSFGYCWTSSATGSTSAMQRHFATGLFGVRASSDDKSVGFSVRCIKD